MDIWPFFLPDDVRNVSKGYLENEDDLVGLERDEWLELQSPSSIEENLAGNGRSTTTPICKWSFKWYTNETSSNRLLLQDIEIVSSNTEDGFRRRCAWVSWSTQESERKGGERPAPCFLSGSVLHMASLGRSSIEIPLENDYDTIFVNSLGILLISESGTVSLLHHLEEPVIPVNIQLGVPQRDLFSRGKVIWSSSKLPFIISYENGASGGNLMLWKILFDHNASFASLQLLKEESINHVPDVQIATCGGSKYLIIINKVGHYHSDSKVLLWPVVDLVPSTGYALEPSIQKVLPMHIDGHNNYLVAITTDSRLSLCRLDGNRVLDFSLTKCGKSFVLSPSGSAHCPPIATKFTDIKDISGCNVTVCVSSKVSQYENIRAQLSFLPLSSWMRGNIDASYFRYVGDNHLLDWDNISGSRPVNQKLNDIDIDHPYTFLKMSKDHADILCEVSDHHIEDIKDRRTWIDEDLSLNVLDCKIAKWIEKKGINDSHVILKNGRKSGERSRVIQEVVRKLRDFDKFSGELSALVDTNQFLQHLLDNSWTLEEIQKLPFNLAIPILSVLEICAQDADISHPLDALLLEDRPDLAAGIPDICLESQMYNPFHHDVLIPVVLDDDNKSKNVQEGVDNLQPDLMAHRFGSDTRVFEARELLSSSKPISLHMNEADEAGQGAPIQQQQLHLASKRTLALAVGRGAMALCTYDTLPTEMLDSPNIDLSGRIVEKNDAIVTLDLTSEPVAAGGGAMSAKTAWPEFHNGVASALRISPGGELSRTWIVYNKPENPSYDHAGFLFGLGLTGQLSCLTVTDLYRYLSHEHDATLVGVLLGMSSSRKCSMDSTLTKMLFLHLPARHPIGYPDLEISPVVQCAALVGLGLLYQGSSQRSITETLLQEIERTSERDSQNQKQVNDLTKGNEAYSLCAGFALGLVCLGKGADQDMEAKLHYLLVGGTKSGNISRKSTLSKVNSATRTYKREDFINEMISSSNQNIRNSSGQTSGAVAEELAAAQGAAKTIMEGDLINLNATSPAAALALGLMYLKSGNQRIADAFYIPDSVFGLRMVNPEHICLRIAMKSLIMWDTIDPSQEWLERQLPQILLSVPMDFQHLHRPDSDPQVVYQAACFAMTGCCLALGLKFAGSQNTKARSLIGTCLSTMIQRKCRVSQLEIQKGISEVLETCITSMVMSLAVVMAGSGDLGVFSTCRALLNRMPKSNNNGSSIFYGSYLGASLSIGFLFMSGGARTFDTSTDSVAYLLLSIFPVLSTSPTDNKGYLQAFRHFYVLAARRKITDCVSIRSNRYVKSTNRAPVQDGPDIRYVLRDVDDPGAIHAIHRSFIGFPGPEVDRILSRVGIPPSVNGYIHVTGKLSTDGCSILSSGDMRICSVLQPRLLTHLMKLIHCRNKLGGREAALDLWIFLNRMANHHPNRDDSGRCRKSLRALCGRLIPPSIES